MLARLGVIVLAMCWSCSMLLAQQGTWQSKTLSNGLLVNYCQDSTRTLLHLGLTLRGGSSLDLGEYKGLSRMYEHLFFQYLPSGSLVGNASDAGMFLSHKTQLEAHFFGMSIPQNQLPVALGLLQTGLSATEWNDSTMNVAQKAVLRELQALDNAPEQQLAIELATHLWGSFASGKHSMERYADVLRLGAQQIMTGLAPYRHPANCQLNATGPADAQGFWEAAEANLGAWMPEGQGAILPKIQMPELTQSLYFQSVNEFAPQPLVMIAWPVQMGESPADLNREAQHFCQLAQLKSGLMYQHLVDSGLALDYTWTWAGGLNPGQLLLYVIPEKDRFAECMRTLHTELDRLGDPQYYTKEEVAAAGRLLQLQAAKAQDQSIPRLLQAGQAWMLSTDPASEAPSIHLSTMQAFAKAYVQGKPHVAGLLLNSELVASIDPETNFRASSVSAISSVSGSGSVSANASESLPTYMDAEALGKYRVHFPLDEGLPDSLGNQALKEIASMLRNQPQKRIFINSFSQGLGDGVKNYQLSVARAKAMRALMVEKMGVPVQQIVIRAYGEAFPETPDDKDLRNRRMSFEYAPPDAQDNAF